MRLVLPFIGATGLLAAALPEARGFIVQLASDFAAQDIVLQFGVVAGLIGALGMPGLLLSLPGVGEAARLKAQHDELVQDKLALMRRIENVAADIALYADRSPARLLASGARVDAAGIARMRAGNLDPLLMACEGLVRITLKGPAAPEDLKRARAAADFCNALGWKPDRLAEMDQALHGAEHAAGLRGDAAGRSFGRVEDAQARVIALSEASLKHVQAGDYVAGLRLAEEAVAAALASGISMSQAGLRAEFERIRSTSFGGLPGVALEGLDKLIPLQKQVLGAESIDVLMSHFQRAQTLTRLRRNEEALAELSIMLPLAMRLLDKPNITAIRFLHAQILNNLRRFEEAASALEVLLPAQKEVLGELHPQIFVTRMEYAQALAGSGRVEDAEAELSALLPVRISVQGEQHPQVLITRGELAVLWLKLGRFQEAFDEAAHLLPQLRASLHAGHTAIRDTLDVLTKAEQALKAKQAD